MIKIKRPKITLAAIFFFMAFLLTLDQMRLNPDNIPFEVKDIHHELFIVMFLFAGIVLVILSRLKRKQLKEVL